MTPECPTTTRIGVCPMGVGVHYMLDTGHSNMHSYEVSVQPRREPLCWTVLRVDEYRKDGHHINTQEVV